MKKAFAVVVIVVLSLVAACGPSAPAPTPTPTPLPSPTPVEVLATKPEHLVGIWFVPDMIDARWYVQYKADGTFGGEWSRDLVEEHPIFEGRCWFEDGVYYEESQHCNLIGSYRAYLEIEGARAVGLRFEEIDDSDPDCWKRRHRLLIKWTRVDR